MQQNQKLIGSTYIVISALFFASYGVWSRLMADSFDKFSQAWIRGLVLLFLVGVFGLVTKKFRPIRKGDLKWFCLISLAGGLNQAPYYFGFEHLSIGTATLLFYMALVFGTYLIGWLFFAERLSFDKLAGLALVILGLAAMYQLVLLPTQFVPAMSTLLAGLMGAAGVSFTKKVSGDYSEAQILTGYFVVMFLANLLLSVAVGENLPALISPLPWLWLLLYAFSLLVANASVIAGFKYLEPSVAGLLGTLEVVFAVLFGGLFFGEAVTPETMTGSVIILLGVILPDIRRLHGLSRLT